MIKILVIDDEKEIRSLLFEILGEAGFSVDLASGGHDGLEHMEETEYGLVILDVMMPDMDGWSVLRRIREAGKTPVIMLTARDLENDEIFGFELGADEYITKPFRKSILLARVRAVLKRAGQLTDQSQYNFKNMNVDTRAVKVYVEGEEIGLSHTEYELLITLVMNPGAALSREQLLDKVWGMDYFGGVRTVDTHIKRLRNKLGVASGYIETVRGIGYRFEGEAIVD